MLFTLGVCSGFKTPNSGIRKVVGQQLPQVAVSVEGIRIKAEGREKSVAAKGQSSGSVSGNRRRTDQFVPNFLSTQFA